MKAPTADEILNDLTHALDAWEGDHRRDPHASASMLVLLRRLAEAVASRGVECAAGVTFGETHSRAAVEWAGLAHAVSRLSPCLACGGTRIAPRARPSDARIPCPACGGR